MSFSEALRCSFIDDIGICDKLIDSLADFCFICAKKVNLSLNSKLITSSDAWLGILTLTYQEGQLWVSALDGLIVGADVVSTFIKVVMRLLKS